MSDTQKPRIRIPAGTTKATEPKSFMTRDAFANVTASLGYGTNNLSTAGTYGFTPITRNHILLEWAYRGSWIVQQVVDSVADDMTRSGVSLDTDGEPDDMDTLMEHFDGLRLWGGLNEAIKWSRLYGGCLAVVVIAGQSMDTPLRTDTVGKGQFKGLIVLDRWMVWAHVEETVDEPGPFYGLPKYYSVVADARAIQINMRIHYTRVIRFDGVNLPYWQKMAENGWGLSVIEPLYDRLLAFDSVTQGAAQLAYKAHLRTLKVNRLRDLIAVGGTAYEAFIENMRLIRLMQSNEGMTVLDSEDEFQVDSYSFTGLPELMMQFAEQLAGAAQIPLTRLFGQSPAGLNATGESDMRNYYDAIMAEQEAKMRRGLILIFDILHRSVFGNALPDGFSFSFNSMWQMTDAEKAQINAAVTQAVDQAAASGLIGRAIALKELKQSSHTTGYWSNITDQDIEDAKLDDKLPKPEEMGLQPGSPLGGADHPPPPDPASATLRNAAGQAKDDADADADAAAAKPNPARELLRHLYPHNGKTRRDLVGVMGRSIRPRSRADVAKLYNNPGSMTRETLKRMFAVKDRRSIVYIHDIPCIVETAKGEQRIGHGWASVMPCDYGYISGTSSEEGGIEQTDVYIGPNPGSDKVWIIQQTNPATKQFDEAKVMLGFDTKEEAGLAYEASFSDGSGASRVGRVMSMSIGDFKEWLANRPYTTATWRKDRGSEPVMPMEPPP